MIGRVCFGVLAVADAVLLLYLFLNYDWFNVTVTASSASSTLGVLVVWIAWAAVVAERAFFVAYFAVLLIALAGIGVVGSFIIWEIAARPPGFINDSRAQEVS